MFETSLVLPADGRPDIDRAHRALHFVAMVAAFSIVLGFTMQGLILVARLAGGEVFARAGLLLDVAQGLSWSVLVCTGVAVATSLAKSKAAVAGMLSALFAPVALAITRSGQKVLASLLDAAGQPAILSIGTVSTLRAVEYGLLGWLLARLVSKGAGHPLPYLGAGGAIGVLFGGAIAVLTYQVAAAKGAALSDSRMIATAINEVVFPIGCAFVIYLGQLIGSSMKLIGDEKPASR